MNDLQAFFIPDSVAIIGASREAGKLGHGVVRNLLQSNYAGAIYPVNPHADEILGLAVYPSIDSLPESLDLAVIVLPAAYVAPALKACGERGIRAAIVVSGGFREIGAEGERLEHDLQTIAQDYHIALLGPNCIGIIDQHSPINTTFVTGTPPVGNIAFLSQSGALVAALIDRAQKTQIGLSRMISLGNEAIITESDMLATLSDDPNTKVVMTYIEGIVDGQAFVKTARMVSANKPIIALKGGRSTSGAKAAASHTGALAGSESAYDAAFRRAGILRANTIEEMLDWAQAFAMQPLPGGNRVAVLSNAGGPAILAVDALAAHGMQLAQLSAQTKTHLRENLPPAASVHNPVDILAGSLPPTYALCLEALLQDENVDAVVIITAPQDWFDPLDLAKIIADLNASPAGCEKSILTVLMGPEAESPMAQLLRECGIPNFDFPERVGNTLGAMWRRQEYLSSLKDMSATVPDYAIDFDSAKSVLTMASDQLSTKETHRLLQAYGMKLPKQAVASTLEQAAVVAEQIGFPLAMKLLLKGLTHKTDFGGVILHIDSVDSLKAAFTTLQERIPEGAEFEGILLQEMLDGELEVIVGIVRDPIFGPLLMVGSGGTQVELMGDVTFELAPITRIQAVHMLQRSHLGRMLAGYRGRAAADREALIDIMQLISQIALDQPQISEIEINPLIVRSAGAGAAVVDVRVRLEAGAKEP